MSNNSEHNKNDGPPGESLAERSARLEAEAQGLYAGDEDDNDPLAPEPLPEDALSDNAGADVIALQEKISALEAELDTTKDKMLRAVAEAENTKRRALKEGTDAKKFAVSSFARDLLPVADNLKRAIEAVPEDLKSNEHIINLIEGIEATERELLRTFEKNGLQKLEPLDQVFDPNFHEVMFETPMPEKPAGTIIQVMETGYILNGRLIRPARVGVVKDDGQGSGGQTPSSDPGSTIDTSA
ncbi:MAG: nucleotide exchange factor GrpE [Alphaproteobacteria bacterium]